MQTLAIRLLPGTDLYTYFVEFAKENKTDAAIILSCVGSLNRAFLRLAAAAEVTEFAGPLEIITLSGNFSVSGLHLHLSVADSSGKLTGGHLREGSIIRTTAEIVIGLLDDVSFERVPDEKTGYKELKVVKK